MVSKTAKKSKEKLTRVDGKKDELLGGKLSFWSLLYLWFRSTTLIQASFNYGYYQGTGYSHAIYPFVKRIFKNNKARLKETLIGNIEFFNSGPCMGISGITAMHIFMLQTGSSAEQAKRVKFALMGPLAGINDALFNFGAQPLVAGIAASLSTDGSWTGVIFWLVIYNAIQFTAGILITVFTYKSSQKFMSDLSNIMSTVVKLASMVGITIIAALSLTYTNIHLALTTIPTSISEGTISVNVTDYQAVIDRFLPYALPIFLIGFVYMMMKKYDWSIYKVLVFIILMGISGYVFGIFAK